MLRFIYHHYGACMAAGFLILCSLSLYYNLNPFVYSFLALAIFSFLYFSASRYVRRVTNAYTEDCDPEPYLEHGLWGIRRFQKARSSRRRASLVNSHLHVVAALCALGRYGEALDHLDLLDRSALPPYSRIVYWYDRFSVFLHLDQPPAELARLLSLAQDSLDSAKFPPSQQRTAERAIEYARLLLLIREEGPSRDAVSRLERHLSSVATEQERVHCHFHLATTLLALDDKPAAREHLDYVIAHGNKLYARTQALELLSPLSL